MGKTLALEERPQTVGEEIANSVSHGLALALSIAALPVLVMFALERGDALVIAGASIFGVTMVLLYLSSTVFHALRAGRAKRVFQILDHSAIYLLIAGTYTPFTLGVLRGTVGWTLFAVVWSLAVVGTVMKSMGGVRFTRISIWTYLAMGWLVVFAADAVIAKVPNWGLFWLLAGGIAYTAGAVFFMAERIKFFHFIWHLFVVLGTACHFVAVLFYAA